MVNQSVARLSYTVDELRRATGFSRNAVYNAIARGELRSFKNGKRRLFSADAVNEFIARLERQTADGLPSTPTPRSPGRPRKPHDRP